MKGSNLGTMPENPNKNKGIESGSAMPENPKQNEGNEFGRFQRIQNKRKGSNLDAMLENLNQNKGIESGRDARELETK